MTRKTISYEIDAGANKPIKMWADGDYLKMEQGGEQIHFDFDSGREVHSTLGEMLDDKN